MYLFPEIAFPISARDAQSEESLMLVRVLPSQLHSINRTARSRFKRRAAAFSAAAFYFDSTLKSLPVISFGLGIPKTPSMVGAMSRSAPPGLSRIEPSSCRRINGTGFVVW